MGASFNRTRGEIRWRLVALTVALVSFATINLANSLVVLSNSYSLYNRDFPSINHLQSGPMGYKAHIYREAISVIPSIMFPLNQWLADGLLVSSASELVPQMSDLDCPPSSTVVIASMP